MADSFPKLDITTFFLSVSTAAIQSLSETKPDLMMAKQNIDLLELMKDKTKGNLTSDEDQLINHLLFQLRMTYVEAEKKK